jgi:hypothetical protein
MSNLYGADVDQLRQLSSELAQQAEQLGSAASRVSGRVDNTAWRGPDAEGFRADWKGQHAATIRAAQQQLQDASAQALANAKAQEEASGVGSGGTGSSLGGGLFASVPGVIGPWGTPSFTFQDFINETEGVVSRPIPGLPWSLTDLGGVVPGVGGALNIRDLVDKASNGAVPIDEIAHISQSVLGHLGGHVGGLGAAVIGDALNIKDLVEKASTGQFPIHELADTARGVVGMAPGPVGYLGSAAIGTWDFALKQAEQADFSQAQIDTNMNYILTNPGDALAGAGDALVKALPNLISIFT